MSNRKESADRIAEAEALILSLRNVKGVNISLEDDEIAEINVLADGDRSPKQIVRDVRSALKADLKMDIDYRKISVAQRRENLAVTEPRNVLELVPAAEEDSRGRRVRFGGVTVSINTFRAHVQVELGLLDQETIGEASGGNSKDQVPRLIAQATLHAVERFLSDDYLLSLNDLQVISLGGSEVVLAGVRLVADRRQQFLTGSCVVDHDLQQSVVYATLGALNRVLGRMTLKEPVEYELRPTSI